jgi:hypothetical protein
MQTDIESQATVDRGPFVAFFTSGFYTGVFTMTKSN